MARFFQYFCTVLAVAVTTMLLADTWTGDLTHPIWLVLNSLVVLTLSLVVLNLATGNRIGLDTPTSCNVAIVTVLAFITYTATFIDFQNGESIVPLRWLLADAFAVIALFLNGAGLPIQETQNASDAD